MQLYKENEKNELYFSKFYCAARMCYGNSEYSLIFLRLKQIVKCQEKDFCTIGYLYIANQLTNVYIAKLQ